MDRPTPLTFGLFSWLAMAHTLAMAIRYSQKNDPVMSLMRILAMDGRDDQSLGTRGWVQHRRWMHWHRPNSAVSPDPGLLIPTPQKSTGSGHI